MLAGNGNTRTKTNTNNFSNTNNINNVNSSPRIDFGAGLNSTKKTTKTYDLKLWLSERILLIDLLKDAQDAGTGIENQLRKIKDNSSSKRLKAVAEALLIEIENGEFLSDAMRKMPNAFPGYMSALIAACEASGEWTKSTRGGEVKLGILDLLLSFLKRTQKARRKLIGGMLYPSAIILVLIGVVAIFSVWILPVLKEIFISLNVFNSIGTLGQGLFNFTEWLQVNYIFIPIFIGALAFAVYQMWKLIGAQLWEKYQLRIRGINKIFILSTLAESLMLLGVLYRAGIHITDALPIVGNAARNREVGKAFDKAKSLICEGESLPESLKQSHFIFDGDVVFRISAAEDTGKLEETLLNYSSQQFEKLDEAIDVALSFLEPVMLVVIGGVIGLLLVSIYGSIGSAIAHIR